VAQQNSGSGFRLEDSMDCEVLGCNTLANAVDGILLAGTSSNNYIYDNNLVANSGINFNEDASTGPNAVLGNFAQNPSLATNYNEGLSRITTVTIQQSVAWTSSPARWDNINMIP